MKPGDLVREILGWNELCITWGHGTLGIIIRSADPDEVNHDELLPGEYCFVAWGNGRTYMVNKNDIEVVNESR
jgi:hypothetical protein